MHGFYSLLGSLVLGISAAFLFLPAQLQAANPLLALEADGAKLYTYKTQCKSPAFGSGQAFILPAGVGTIDNFYLHFSGSDNPSPSTLCTNQPGQSLCAAATTLSQNSIRAAIILSLQNADQQPSQSERECMLAEAKEEISSLVKVQSTGYTVTASEAGSKSALTFFEQGFSAKKTIILGGCHGDICAKISKFKDSGQLLLYAITGDLASVTEAYQADPQKIFALSLPNISQYTLVPGLCYLDHVLGNKCNSNAQAITISLPNDYGIGQSCSNTITNNDCKNKLDCEDSSIDGDDNFCVCSTNEQCAAAYGDSTKPNETWECKDGTGEDKAFKLHYCVSNTNKIHYPIQQQEVFKEEDGSLLGDLTKGFNQTPLTEAQILALIQKPNPKIKIPGLAFTDLTINGKLTSDDEGSAYLEVPYLGEYVKAVYNYLILIAGVVCVARIMVAGFIYTAPDTSGEAKSSAIKMIQNALIGLLLAVGSYTLLYLFNPELVEFKNLKVFYSRGEPYFEAAELPQNVAGGFVAGPAAVSAEAQKSIGGLVGGPNSLPNCSPQAAQAAAKTLHDKKICVGPVHCAYTATRFLQYIGCSSKTLTGNANYMVGNLEQEGWVSLEITEANASSLPVGALWFPGHAGVSTGEGTMFESTIGGAFDWAADKKGCPNLSGQASPSNCGYCAQLAGHEPWQKNAHYKNGTGKNQGWKTSGVKNIKQFRLVIYPAPASVARPPLGCCKFSGGKQNLASKLFCQQVHIKKDGRGKITSNDWNETYWNPAYNSPNSCPTK